MKLNKVEQFNRQIELCAKNRKNGHLMPILNKEELYNLCKKITPPSYHDSVYINTEEQKVSFYSKSGSYKIYKVNGIVLEEEKYLKNWYSSERSLYEIIL